MYDLHITSRLVDRHFHHLSHRPGLINVQLNDDIANAIRPRRKRTLGQNVVPALGRVDDLPTSGADGLDSVS